MTAILSKLFSSKALSITALLLIIILLVTIGVIQVQKKGLNQKIDDLNKTIDNKEEIIIELNQQIKVKDFEIQYLQKGISIANSYEKEKEKVLEDETTTKVQILEKVMSTEENKDWWNTPIPADILDLITCR
jgi:predicted PurR-regulated permease PerM